MIGALRRLAACALAVGLLTGCGGEDFEAEQFEDAGEATVTVQVRVPAG
jgi:hypothetical protein